MPEPAERRRFATTRWTLVVAAGSEPSPEAAAALETLCQAYWLPLYAFLRARGHDADEAKDLTQAFFAHVLEKRTLQQADPSRGRFRSFLLASLKNFAANEAERQRAVKRGGGVPVLSLEIETAEGRWTREPVTHETPETLFDREWALALLTRALGRLREEMRRKDGYSERLKGYLTSDAGQPSYAETAACLGMSEGAVKVAVHRLRRRFRDLVREEIAQTVTAADDVDDEIRYLLSSVSR